MFPQPHNTPYLLDTIDGALLACSCRKLLQQSPTNYARIRRSSDNTEAYVYQFSDFIYPTSPTDNVAGSISDFVGGGNAFVRQFIDHVGVKNGNQTTANLQPKLTNDGLGKISTLHFQNNTTQQLDYGSGIVANLTGADKKFSIVLCFKHGTSITAASPSLISMFNTLSGFTGLDLILRVPTNNNQTFEIRFGNGTNFSVLRCSEVFPVNTIYSLVVTYDGTIDTAATNRVEFFANNTLLSHSQISSGGSFPFDISAPPQNLTMPWVGGSSYSGYLGEFIIFDKVLDTSEIDIIYKQHKNYFGA